MVRDLLIVREKSEDFHECLRFLEEESIRAGAFFYKVITKNKKRSRIYFRERLTPVMFETSPTFLNANTNYLKTSIHSPQFLCYFVHQFLLIFYFLFLIFLCFQIQLNFIFCFCNSFFPIVNIIV